MSSLIHVDTPGRRRNIAAAELCSECHLLFGQLGLIRHDSTRLYLSSTGTNNQLFPHDLARLRKL